ncbi:hypothetical protein HaLaN_31503, partial [Haematococcus lacustris]
MISCKHHDRHHLLKQASDASITCFFPMQHISPPQPGAAERRRVVAAAFGCSHTRMQGESSPCGRLHVPTKM